jgi:hypothetical protein
MRNLVIAFSLVSCCLAVTGCPAPVGVYGPGPGGWVQLGERTVNGRGDRDIIHVGRREGRFRQLQFTIENSSLEMYDMIVYFGDGSSYSPPTRLVFHPGQASRVIDLPGGARVIKRVEFRYGNPRDRDHRNAHIVLFGS